MAAPLMPFNQLSAGQQKRLLGAARSGKMTGKPIAGTDAQVARQIDRIRTLQGRGSMASAFGKAKKPTANKPGATRPRAVKKPAPAPKPGAKNVRVSKKAPSEAAARTLRGQDTDADRRAIKRWRAGRNRPLWIPKDAEKSGISDSTAAMMSWIDLDPKRWKSIEFTYNADGTVTVTVQPKGANQYGPFPARVVVLQDRASSSEMLGWLSQQNYPGLQVKNNYTGGPSMSAQQAMDEAELFRMENNE